MFRGYRGRGRHHANRQNLGLLLLALQIFQFGVDRIPLVTLITLLTNIGVFLHVPELFDIPLPSVQDICISYQGVVVYREYSRLVLSGFYHLSDMHLYYNMASLLYKGTQLEPRYGSSKFAVILSVLLVGSSTVYCALQYCTAVLFGSAHTHTCSAGFSAVLFGLKVLMQDNSAPSHRLFGIPIHMAYWSELIWISIISPNVSFVGHLAGIITGLLLTHGPLHFVLTGNMPSFVPFGRHWFTAWGSGASGHSNTSGNHSGGYSNQRRSNNSNNNASSQEDAELQEAIRRRLNEDNPSGGNSAGPTGYSTGPTGYSTGPTGYSTGPTGYSAGPTGYSTGPTGYSTGPTGYSKGPTGNSTGSRLYPDIPVAPSAPPPEPGDDTSTHHHSSSNTHHSSGLRAPDLPLDVDEIRRRRVQRFH